MKVIPFQNYKTIYDDLKRNEKNLTDEIKNIVKRHTSMIDSLKKTKDRNLFMSLETQTAEIKKKHDSLKSNRKQTRETLIEFEFIVLLLIVLTFILFELSVLTLSVELTVR